MENKIVALNRIGEQDSLKICEKTFGEDQTILVHRAVIEKAQYCKEYGEEKITKIKNKFDHLLNKLARFHIKLLDAQNRETDKISDLDLTLNVLTILISDP